MRGVNIESLDILRFFLVSVRYDYVVVALLLCRNDNGKNAVYTAKLAVERQLSEKDFIFNLEQDSCSDAASIPIAIARS